MGDFKDKIQASLNEETTTSDNGQGFSTETLEQIEALAPKVDEEILIQAKAEVEDQKARAFAQGLTFGFADEIEGFVKSLLNKKVTYEQARDQVRTAVAEYQEANKGEGLALEIAGAVVPTVISLFGGPAGWANALRTITTLGSKLTGRMSIGQSAHVAGKGTALYSVGKGEEGLVQDIANAPMGYLAGATIGGTIQGTGQIGTEVINRLLSTEVGKKFGPIVRAQLEKMVQKTGLTPQQIVQKVKDGELMVENETLRASIKALTATDSAASKKILDTVNRRPLETRKDLLDQMQKNIGKGDSSKNIQKMWQSTQDDLRQNETAMYKLLFEKQNPQLPAKLAKDLEETMKMFPDLFDELNKLYSTTPGNIVPFFQVLKNGELKLIRQPSLQDAEMVYRALRDTADLGFRGNMNKGLAGNIADMAKSLKKKLNKFSPALEDVRLQASHVRVGRDAFEYGEKLLSQNVEKIALELEKFGKTPGAMDALKAGFMSTLKHRSQQPSTIKNIAEEGQNFNQIVRMIFPDTADDVIKQAGIARQANEARQSIKYNTTTAREQAASDQMSQAAAIARFKQNPGDIAAGILIVKNFITARSPDLTPKAAQQVAEVVTSKNSKLVQQALIDESKLPLLERIIDSTIYNISRAAGQGVAKVGGSELEDRHLSSSGLLGYTSGALQQFTGMQQ